MPIVPVVPTHLHANQSDIFSRYTENARCYRRQGYRLIIQGGPAKVKPTYIYW